MPISALIPAVIGAGASIIGSSIASDNQKQATQQASDAQVRAAQLGVDEQHRQYDQTRADNQPFLTAGVDALGQERGLLGLDGPTSQQAGIDSLRNSPLYKSLYRNGNESILADASATGGLRGGNTEHSLYNLGNDTLSSVIQNQLANLGGIRSGGQSAGSTLGQLGANTANAVSGLYGQQGAAQSGGILTRSAISAANTNNLFSSLGLLFNGNQNSSNGSGNVFGSLGNSISNLFHPVQYPQYGTSYSSPY